MYIQPNTTVKLLHNCPLDNTYEHTIFFDSVTQQTNYFNGFVKYTLPAQYYQRVNKQSLKVQLCADDIYDCNYIMFQNTSYSNRWFYGFITAVEYINNTVSQVTYEIDVMQTWFFDYTLGQCFVEREHTDNDTIGANTIPEDIERGDYITTKIESVGDNVSSGGNTVGIAILVTGIPESMESISEHFSEPAIISGLPNPCYVFTTTISNDTPTIISLIANLYNSDTAGNDIVSIFTYPVTFCNPNSPGGRVVNINGFTPVISKRADGSNVRNNKLYTYPFYSLVVSANGQSAEYKNELFSGGQPSFQTMCAFSPNPKVFLAPVNYAGYDIAYQNGITLSGFPQLAWKNDGYQQYIAQHSGSLEAMQKNADINVGVGVVQGALSTGSMLATGTPNSSGVTGLSSALQGVNTVIGKLTDIQAIPDTIAGVLSSQDTLTAYGRNAFYFYGRAIRPEYVSIIDDYFTRFGYKTNRLKVPNRNVRQRWCYTKAVEVTITGSVPTTAMKIISTIYNNGITFWKSTADIGDYTKSNNIV